MMEENSLAGDIVWLFTMLLLFGPGLGVAFVAGYSKRTTFWALAASALISLTATVINLLEHGKGLLSYWRDDVFMALYGWMGFSPLALGTYLFGFCCALWIAGRRKQRGSRG